MSYGELEDKVQCLAASLQGLGLGKGHTLVIWCHNAIEIPLVALAGWRAGLTVSVLNPLLVPGK